MKLSAVLQFIVKPTYSLILPAAWDTLESRALLLAIGLQESRFEYREQIGGPARGFWQFEQGGGVAGVLGHPVSRDLAAKACAERGIEANAAAVYAALPYDDILACTFARLLLRTDPAALPALDDEASAWLYYLRNWRPGMPRHETWAANHAAAVAAVSPA